MSWMARRNTFFDACTTALPNFIGRLQFIYVKQQLSFLHEEFYWDHGALYATVVPDCDRPQLGLSSCFLFPWFLSFFYLTRSSFLSYDYSLWLIIPPNLRWFGSYFLFFLKVSFLSHFCFCLLFFRVWIFVSMKAPARHGGAVLT